MIPPGFIQELLSRVDIVEVIGRHVELKRGGANFMGLCPFHGEKSPSFSVTPTKQFYHCFGCGASGDAIRFLTEHLGLSFVEAVRDLAQGAGLTVPEEDVSPEERQRRASLRDRRLSMNEVLDRAAEFYRGQLKSTPRAIDYLKRRGLTGTVAARFGLGFSPPGWRTLASVFAQYDDPLLEEAGLVRVREADEAGAEPDAQRGRYDWFRDRVMFPIRGVDGKIIGFGGRVLDDSKPKYINSPETPVFSKGRELYGLFEARQALRDKGYALVVEGYMDVVALAQLGFPNAVATLGTACTADHVQKLLRFTDQIVFSFDGDAAGRRAAGRALEAALPHASDTRSIKFLFLPPEHDPDSFVRENGSEAFEEMVQRAVPLSRQLLEVARDGIDTDSAEGRARMLATARPMWSALPEGALRRQLFAELARAGGLEATELEALWGAKSPPQGTAAAPAARRAPSPPRPSSRRALRTTTSSLDRGVWLLVQRCDLWERLDGATHELLSEVQDPHGSFFRWLDRRVHDEGALSPQTLLAEMQAADESLGLEPLTQRIAALHDVAQTEFIETELHIVIDRLRVDALERDLETLTQVQPLTPEVLSEVRRIRGEADELKRRLARNVATKAP